MAERGETVTLETSLPTAAGETVALDVLFLLDATPVRWATRSTSSR